jgi:hypothetical protein
MCKYKGFTKSSVFFPQMTQMMYVQAISIPGIKEMRSDIQKTFNGHCFPLILTPGPEADSKDLPTWCSIIQEHLSDVKSLLAQHGTILFRGFPISSSQEFEEFTKTFDYKNMPYSSGGAPRKHVHGIVSTANEGPPDVSIGFHHEMSYEKVSPDAVFFYCDVAPTSGGQTPVAYSPAVYYKMLEKEPNFVARLEKEGIYMTRHMPAETDPECATGRGWTDAFATDNRHEAEKILAAKGSTCEWQADGSLK